ncbi:MAG: Tol-Pal system beta propeller repeat protein TolB [Candidatus Acidoferrales bacterium]
MKGRYWLSVVLLLGLALLPFRLHPQQDWFRTGTGLGVEKVRLGVPAFAAGSGEVRRVARVFHTVLRNDLATSGIVELVSPSFEPLAVPSLPAELRPEEWVESPTRAHMVAYGNLQFSGNQLFINAWLSDVRNPQVAPVLTRRYRADLTEEQARRLAHQFADEIVARLSGGVPGIARTKIAFVSDRTGSKEIWVMDYDGHNPQRVTRCRFLCLTPRWSPDNSRLAYTAYEQAAASPQVPRTSIQLYSLLMNRRLAFPYLGGTTTTPAWSPEGTQLALSSSRTGDHEIYVVASDGGRMRRLTFSAGVDISPAWNPRTGRQIAFVSDRGGSPQIYLMDSEGASVERLTNGEGYAVSPAWSPNGQMIAFAWQREQESFNIYAMDIATRQTIQLTRDSGRNEQPSWAPDGRHLVFQSTRSGRNQLWLMLADGTGLRQLTFEGRNTAPHWSFSVR